MLGNLLPDKKEESSATSEILIREAIVATKTFEKDFALWMEKGMHKGLLDYLKECIAVRREDPSAAVNLYFHESKNSNGFYFRAESPWNTNDYRFLVHLFVKKLRRQIPYEQLFGNVFIEHRMKGDETELLKIMVNTYTDQYYNKPYDFEDFLTELCLP